MRSLYETEMCWYQKDKIINSSFFLRKRRRDSHWLMNLAVQEIPNIVFHDIAIGWFSSIREDTILRMKNKLQKEIRSKYGNPIIAWFLLYVILPIVVRLVINWWIKKLKSENKL